VRVNGGADNAGSHKLGLVAQRRKKQRVYDWERCGFLEGNGPPK
jgi:hypothetical protein